MEFLGFFKWRSFVTGEAFLERFPILEFKKFLSNKDNLSRVTGINSHFIKRK